MIGKFTRCNALLTLIKNLIYTLCSYYAVIQEIRSECRLLIAGEGHGW